MCFYFFLFFFCVLIFWVFFCVFLLVSDMLRFFWLLTSGGTSSQFSANVSSSSTCLRSTCSLAVNRWRGRYGRCCPIFRRGCTIYRAGRRIVRSMTLIVLVRSAPFEILGVSTKSSARVGRCHQASKFCNFSPHCLHRLRVSRNNLCSEWCRGGCTA